MKKVLLFDFGGTLDTNGVHWSEKYWEAYKKLGLSISKKQYEEAYVYSESYMTGVVKTNDSFKTTLIYQILFQLLFLRKKKYIIPEEDNNLLYRISDICYKDVLVTTNYNKKLLKELNADYRLGLVSNFYGNLSTVLNELSFTEYFEVVVDSYEIGIKKPDSRIFQKTIDKFNELPENIFVIGDSYSRDIVPAKTIGCKTIWLDGKSWTRPNNTSQADFIIHSIEEVRGIVFET
jgi:putative hydrolase of the HAD superfamily